jgi:hypothetical protein
MEIRAVERNYDADVVKFLIKGVNYDIIYMTSTS